MSNTAIFTPDLFACYDFLIYEYFKDYEKKDQLEITITNEDEYTELSSKMETEKNTDVIILRRYPKK